MQNVLDSYFQMKFDLFFFCFVFLQYVKAILNSARDIHTSLWLKTGNCLPE